MFYLNFAFQKILKDPFKALSFIFLSILMITSASYYNLVQEKIAKFSKVQTIGPSFHALVNSQENAHWIARKIKEIPGVTNVNVIEKEKIAFEARKQLQGIIKETSPQEGNPDEVSESILSSSYYGIKVVCDKGTSERTILLLREYMVRLAGGPEKIILGKVTEFNQQIKVQGQLFMFMKKELIPLGLIIIFLFWIISFFAFESKLRESSYLIEKFQRRRKVAFKTLIIYLSIITSLSIIPFLILENYTTLNFLLVVVLMTSFSFLELRKNKWAK